MLPQLCVASPTGIGYDLGMTYSGHIRNGVAVLDDDVKLPEGTPVIIQPAPEGSLQEVLGQVSGKGKNLPDDGSLQHDHYISGTPKR